MVHSPNRESLIPGFVINGTVNKRVLLRAIGPTSGTSTFNVLGALPDPRVVLKRWSGTAFVDVASNDNWSANANASEIGHVAASLLAFAITDDSLDAAAIAQIAARTAAFPLPTGSKDVAFAATFAPGVYTAIVRGINGAAGSALVDAYTVE